MSEIPKTLDPLRKALVSECESYKEANKLLIEENQRLRDFIEDVSEANNIEYVWEKYEELQEHRNA